MEKNDNFFKVCYYSLMKERSAAVNTGQGSAPAVTNRKEKSNAWGNDYNVY